MKFNPCLMFAALFVASFVFTSVSNAQQLIEIELKIKGTTIDRVPNFVEVITSNPRAAAAQLFAAGGVNLEEDTRGNGRFTVFHHKVLHVFHTVADYKSMLQGHAFKDGDVVYKYWLGSEAEEKEFVERFGLQVAERNCRVGETPVTLYAASPGYFVICSGKRRVAAH
ncbi:hypothetical protein [Aporhodopirellula aestuarii]|uniref:Uncharacterized protein n=1 Tax=Aporhodopirellula aestuarii TaxID=2950107 RepID=A0ABT0U9P5_9BACT|nr:hypothetical protein [Aporhodopirellula aestuarii]MCM2373591.1 hypothetical protein [Aporhodopirellula aestuarii]